MLNHHNFAISDFAPKENGRYTVTGVYVTPCETVATNGHYLVWVGADSVQPERFPVIPDFDGPRADFRPFIMATEKAKMVAQVTKRGPRHPSPDGVAISEREANGETEPVVACLDSRYQSRTETNVRVRGQFPNYEAVMPKWNEAKFRVAVNASYLAKLAKAFERFADPETKMVVLSFYGADKAIRMDASRDGQGMTAVLMPLRGADDMPAGAYGASEPEDAKDAGESKDASEP